MLSKSSVRCNTEANYDSQWRGFEAYCATTHRPPTDPLLLSPSLVRHYGGLVVGMHAEIVLLNYIGWMSSMKLPPKETEYHYMASTVYAYLQVCLQRPCGDGRQVWCQVRQRRCPYASPCPEGAAWCYPAAR